MNKNERSFFEGLRDIDPYFIGEGEEVVKALFNSKIEVISILMEEHYLAKVDIPPDVKVKLATKEELKKITGYVMHQGIMALGVKPQNVPISQMKGAAVVLNGVVNAENVGAIIRNAVAFGVKNLVVDKHSSPPYLRRTIKVSRGALFQMNLHITSDLPALLKTKNSIAACLTSDAVNLDDIPFTKDPYFVFGREGTGIDKDVLDTCPIKVKIPIDPIIDSLNVAVACGIILYTHNKG